MIMRIASFMTDIKSFFLIFLSAFISSSCFAENAVLSSDFDRIVPIRVPDSARAFWEKKDRLVNVADIEKMPQDSDWTIDWNNYPDNCRFYVHDSKWGISAEGLTVYSKTVYHPTCSLYLLKLEVAMPADAGPESSRVSAGVFHNGLIHPGRSLQKEIPMKRGECVSCDIPLIISPGLPTFRVMLEISGNVILKKMVLQASPNDPVQDGVTVIEGTLKEVSVLPDPLRSDYPDCRFTALL